MIKVVLLGWRWARGRSVIATIHVLRRLDAARLLTIMTVSSLVAIVHGIRLRRRPICRWWVAVCIGVVGIAVILGGCHPAGAIHRSGPLAAATARVDAAAFTLVLGFWTCADSN